MKVQSRIKLAEQMVRDNESPRDVARMMPRELTKSEVFQIFQREQILRQELMAELEKTPEDQFQEWEIIYDTLIIDRINNEFNIEPEDYTLGVQRYKLEQDVLVKNHIIQINEKALDLNDRLQHC